MHLLRLTLKVITWLSLVFTPETTGYTGKLTFLVASLEKVEKTRGTTAAVLYMQQVRLSILLYLSGEFPCKRATGVSVTHDGIPKVLGPCIEDLRNNLDASYFHKIRMILTILFSTRALSLGKSPKVDSIIEPMLLRVAPERDNFNFKKYLRGFWKELGYSRLSSVPKSVWWKSYHFTTKAGPNGHALWTSMNDLWNLSFEDRQHLSILGGKKFSKTIEDLFWLKDRLTPMFSFGGTILRKLTWFPDRELKTRVIAIGDYFTQTALIPLHKFLFGVLRKIPQDCTFNQSSFLEKIKDWKVFYSIDLIDATNRFPIFVIYFVLTGRFPRTYCLAWKHAMVGKPFSYKQTNGEVKLLSYAVGNPMGFYSSWNSFAVAHHFLMYCCCREIGQSWKTAKYVLLGDDILIGDQLLAEKYKTVISGLGVQFSPMKTHESDKLCEFAKRYVFKGKEITPFPISSLKESTKRFYLMVNLLCEQIERGWVPFKGVPEAIYDFYRVVKGFNATMCAKLRDRSVTCELIMKVMRGSLAAHDAFNSITRYFAIPLPEWTEMDSKEFINGFLYEAFVSSDPQFKDNTDQLGKLAEDLVIKITGIEGVEDFDRLFSIPEKVPILNLYGQISEKWLKMRKEADRLQTLTLMDWTIVKPMAIPLSDRIFVERQSHTVSRASAILGDKLVPAMRQLSRPAWTVTFPS